MKTKKFLKRFIAMALALAMAAVNMPAGAGTVAKAALADWQYNTDARQDGIPVFFMEEGVGYDINHFFTGITDDSSMISAVSYLGSSAITVTVDSSGEVAWYDQAADGGTTEFVELTFNDAAISELGMKVVRVYIYCSYMSCAPATNEYKDGYPVFDIIEGESYGPSDFLEVPYTAGITSVEDAGNNLIASWGTVSDKRYTWTNAAAGGGYELVYITFNSHISALYGCDNMTVYMDFLDPFSYHYTGSFASSSVTKTYGDGNFTNTFTTSSSGDVTYSSSDATVATVGSTTGEVAIAGAGSCQITAEVAKVVDSNGYGYGGASFSYTLTVGKATPTSSFESLSVTKTYGGDNFTNTFTTDSDGTITYSSSDESVATVDSSTGEVTIVGAGSADITATTAATTNYESATTSYSLTVNKASHNTAFSVSSVEKNYGDANFTVAYTTDSDATITYYSYNTDVATVDGSTGEVTIVGVGTSRIYVKVPATDNYTGTPGIYTKCPGYTLTVNKGPVAAPVITVAQDETIKGKSDGQLSGVTSAMEYRLEGESEYTAVTGSESDWAAGTYYFRYAETTNTLASDETEVIIGEGRLLVVTFKADGTTVATVEAEYGADITSSVPTTATKAGYTFAGWDIDDFSNITEDMTVNALFTINSYNIDVDGNVSAPDGTKVTIDGDGSYDYGEELTFTVEPEEGYSKTDAFSVTVNGETVTPDEDGVYTVVVTGEVAIEVTGIADITAPEIEITVSTNKWIEFLNEITFGLFFNDTELASVTGSDAGSGVKATYYYLSSMALTKDEVMALDDGAWSGVPVTIRLEPNNTYVIYAKAEDNAGNVAYASSNGMVFDDIAPVISGLSDGGTYYGDVTVDVPEDTTVTIDGEEVDGGSAIITADNKEHTIVVTDRAGNGTSYTVTVYQNYTVAFEADGKIVETMTIGYQQAVTELPEIPAKTGYDQTAPYWSKELDDLASITQDTTVEAVYTANTYSITVDDCVTADEGCTVVITGEGLVEYGDVITVTVTVDDGYEKGEDFAVTVNGIAVEANEDGTYTITVTGDLAIEVTGIEEIALPTVDDLVDGENYYGDTTIIVPDGYTVTVDGQEVTPNEDGTITIPADNEEHTVVVTDENNHSTEYTITVYEVHTVTFVADGITVAEKSVNHGDALTEIPEIPEKTGYTQTAPYWDVQDFSSVTADMTVTAVYTVNTYTVNDSNVASSEGCSVTIQGDGIYEYGEEMEFTVEAEDGYEKGAGFEVLVNGEPVSPDADGIYTVIVCGEISILVNGIEEAPQAANEDSTGITGSGDGYEITPVGEYTFTVEIADGYEKGDNFAVFVDGLEVQPNADGTYTVTGATQMSVITVTGLELKTGAVITQGNYEYEVISKTAVRVVGLKNKSLTKIRIYNKVTFGSTAYKVVSVAQGAFKGNKKITSAVIGKNVRVIGKNAFAGCRNLKKVTIKGNNLKKIQRNAFKGCKKLKKVVIRSRKLKSVGKNAFKGTNSKLTISVPKSKYAKYAKLLKGKGMKKSAKIRKH